MELAPAASSPQLSPADVHLQLERILAANTFANAGRISRLLRYVVERTLAGEGDQLKEYVVGVEVFDRNETYDPRLDSIVRVEARRLRSKLEEYYQGPGKDDPVVITIPRGSYFATFAERKERDASVHQAASPSMPLGPAASHGVHPPTSPPPSRRALAMVGFFAGVITVMLIASMSPRRDRTPTAQASTGPSIAVLPFQHYSRDTDDAMTAARLTDAVTSELARLGTMSVVSRTTASQYTDGLRPAREIAKALNVEFVMESTVTIEGGQFTVVARLVHGEIDRKVWVGEYDASAHEIRDLSRRIAVEAAAGALKYRAR